MTKATGTATPIVNKTSWSTICIPLPPIEEQKRIVTEIEMLLNYVDKLKNRIDNQRFINKIVQVKSIEVSESRELINN